MLRVMPSFTLEPFGCDKSKISLHLLLECFLGTAPRLLTWMLLWLNGSRGPIRRPFSASNCRRSVMTCGCSLADGWLVRAGVHLCDAWEKPMRKPWAMPLRIYCVK